MISFLETNWAHCEQFLENKFDILSLIEQEICSKSDIFLRAQGSSWSKFQFRILLSLFYIYIPVVSEWAKNGQNIFSHLDQRGHQEDILSSLGANVHAERILANVEQKDQKNIMFFEERFRVLHQMNISATISQEQLEDKNL